MSGVSDQAVEAAKAAEKVWLRDNCDHCGRPYASTHDWSNTTSGQRPDLCWEPDGTCSWVLSSIDPKALRLSAAVTAAEPRLRAAMFEGEWTDSDRRDVSAWLRREADERVQYFPQRRDGVDALMRHLARSLDTGSES